MELVKEAPSREQRLSSASGTCAKRSVSRSLSGDGPDGSGGRGPEGGGARADEDEVELVRKLGWAWELKWLSLTIVGRHQGQRE